MELPAGWEVVGQGRSAEDLIKAVPTDVLGARLARARKRQGLSIRELATLAKVNRNPILRIERGGTSQPLTVMKVCSALGLHLASLTDPAEGDEVVVRVHRHEDDRWYDMTDFASGPVVDRVLAPDERARLADKGLPAPMLLLSNRLDEGQILPNVIELYGESPERSHPGEEMIYVLNGRVVLTVGGKQVELAEGEAATFWCSEPHRYAPAKGERLPVRLLSISVQGKRRDDVREE